MSNANISLPLVYFRMVHFRLQFLNEESQSLTLTGYVSDNLLHMLKQATAARRVVGWCG